MLYSTRLLLACLCLFGLPCLVSCGSNNTATTNTKSDTIAVADTTDQEQEEVLPPLPELCKDLQKDFGCVVHTIELTSTNLIDLDKNVDGYIYWGIFPAENVGSLGPIDCVDPLFRGGPLDAVFNDIDDTVQFAILNLVEGDYETLIVLDHTKELDPNLPQPPAGFKVSTPDTTEFRIKKGRATEVTIIIDNEVPPLFKLCE